MWYGVNTRDPVIQDSSMMPMRADMLIWTYGSAINRSVSFMILFGNAIFSIRPECARLGVVRSAMLRPGICYPTIEYDSMPVQQSRVKESLSRCSGRKMGAERGPDSSLQRSAVVESNGVELKGKVQ